jgi:MoxR-like ATPase
VHTPAADAGALERVLFEVKRVIVGQERLVERMLVGLLARGHCLLEGVPGVAKTLAVETLARTVSGSFARIQFTPDLVPSDIVGTRIYRPGSERFDTEIGPIMANFVLADEINRAPAKVQSALLEVMAEQHVTVGGERFDVPRPFLVLATQNPIEYEGTYPLPEAQLDRFLIRLRVGYPSAEDEWLILERRLEREADEPELRPVVSREQLVAMQRAIERVHVSESIGRYIVAIAGATRESRSVQVGASPRGTLALMKLARARAVLDGRDFAVPDDVKALAAPALAHRLTLRPELWVQQVDSEDVVRECLQSVPTPPTEPGR